MSGSKRISELTSATVLSGSEVFPIVQDGETRQANVRALDVFQLVRSVNGIAGDVLLNINDIDGAEQLVRDGGVSAAIGAVSVRVNTVSAAIISVQAVLQAQISAAASSGISDAPSNGAVYARQNASWQIVSVTAIQNQLNAVSALASVNAAAIANVSALVSAAQPRTDLYLACSDEITPLTTGTAIQFSFPRAMTLQSLVLECNTAPTSTTCAIEVRVSGSTLHSGYVNIDPGTVTSRNAATSTSLIKTSIAAWRRGFVSLQTTDATFRGLKLYMLGVAP